MSVFGAPHDTRYYKKLWELNNDREGYKKRLQEKADEDWEWAKKGGVSEEMSIKEALRKRQVEEERRLAEERRIAEEKRITEVKRIAALGPNFPKVWDLSYVRETHKKYL